MNGVLVEDDGPCEILWEDYILLIFFWSFLCENGMAENAKLPYSEQWRLAASWQAWIWYSVRIETAFCWYSMVCEVEPYFISRNAMEIDPVLCGPLVRSGQIVTIFWELLLQYLRYPNIDLQMQYRQDRVQHAIHSGDSTSLIRTIRYIKVPYCWNGILACTGFVHNRRC